MAHVSTPTSFPQPINTPVPAFTAGPGMRFVLLIEGTVAMSGLWPEARSMYLEPLLREMDRGKMGKIEYAVCVYRTRDAAYAGAMVESSGWLSTVGEVRQVLDGLQFLGGGLCETCLCEGLVDVMALLEQPSAINPDGQQPACQAILMCASDSSRVGLVLPYPPAPSITMPGDGGDSGNGVMFRQMANGCWRHNHLSLIAAMKNSHHVSFSLISFKSLQHAMITMFICSMVGYCCNASVYHALISSHKNALSTASQPLVRTHTVLIAPTFTGARSVLKAEQSLRVAAATPRTAAAQPPNAVPGQQQHSQHYSGDGRSVGTNNTAPRLGATPGSTGLPSPALPHPGTPHMHATPPLQNNAHLDPYPSGSQQAQPGMQHGMMPTPPAATPPAPHMAPPIGLNQAPLATQGAQGNMLPGGQAAGAWPPKQGAIPAANQAPVAQQNMKTTGGYAGAGVQQPLGMGQQQGVMDGGMQAGGQGAAGMMGAYNNYNQRPGVQPAGAAAGYTGAQFQQYQHQMAMQQAMQQQQVWNQSQGQGQGQGVQNSLEASSRGIAPAQQAPVQQPTAAPAQPRPMVWLGRLSVAPHLLPSLQATTNVTVVASCYAESNAGASHFDSWPRELVITSLTSHSAVQALLSPSPALGDARRPLKVALRVQQPVVSTPALAAAFAALVDEMASGSTLGTVLLPPGVNGRDQRVLVQLKKEARELPQADSQIMCAYVT